MRKRKKRKYAAEKAKQAKEQGRQNGKEYGNDYNKKRSRHKRNAVKRTIITAVAVVAAIAAVGFYMEKRSYHNYKIVPVQRAGGRNLNKLCGDGWRYPQIQSGRSFAGF